jgi:hypothetical protein
MGETSTQVKSYPAIIGGESEREQDVRGPGPFDGRNLRRGNAVWRGRGRSGGRSGTEGSREHLAAHHSSRAGAGATQDRRALTPGPRGTVPAGEH